MVSIKEYQQQISALEAKKKASGLGGASQEDTTANAAKADGLRAKIAALKAQAGGKRDSAEGAVQSQKTDAATQIQQEQRARFMAKQQVVKALAAAIPQTIPKLNKNNIDDILNQLMQSIKMMNKQDQARMGQVLDKFEGNAAAQGTIGSIRSELGLKKTDGPASAGVPNNDALSFWKGASQSSQAQADKPRDIGSFEKPSLGYL